MKNILSLVLVALSLTTYAQNDASADSTLVLNPDETASYIGGATALQTYINENVEYPQDAIDKNINGRVYTKFVIEANGEITNVEIERGLCESIDKEAIRLVEGMPRWNPATYNNIAVRSTSRMPINFTLTKKK